MIWLLLLQAGPWDNPPRLPAPAGKVVQVSKVADLERAVENLRSDTTIWIAPGTYKLTRTLHIRGGVKNVAIRGSTGKRGDVTIVGRGMKNAEYGDVPHGILVSSATDVLIADLSVGDVWFHPITLQAAEGCDRVRVYNVRLFEAGEQFLKSNPASPDGAKGGVTNSRVEYCVFEYATTARHWYTEGVDVHAGTGWVVRCNLFRNIRGPEGAANVGGAIDFWNRSKNNVAEGNLIYNCAVGIRFGVLDRDGYEDHAGGVIRNNMIYREQGACAWADVGIIVNDSPDTQVVHNTVILNGTYRNAIEVRFASSRNGTVANNLTDGAIVLRDGAKAAIEGNLTDAKPGYFVGKGDLHLGPGGGAAVDRVRALAPEDYDGAKRPANGADVGADERR